jgi:hypothetical protein
MAVTITRMARADVPAVARLHAEVFDLYDSTALGAAYLKALYYTLAEYPACISTVAREDGAVLGWVGGVLNYRAYNRKVTRRCVVRAPFIILSILRNRPRLLGPALAYGGNVLGGWIPRQRRNPPAEPRPAGPNAPTRPSPRALLLVVGVEATRRGQGLSGSMIADFHRRLSQEGFKSCTANVRVENEAGNRAFIKAGYRLLWSASGVNHYEIEMAAERKD